MSNDLAAGQGHGAVTEESQLLTVARAADNLEKVRGRGREGQVSRGLE
jgi:hypothetical protein